MTEETKKLRDEGADKYANARWGKQVSINSAEWNATSMAFSYGFDAGYSEGIKAQAGELERLRGLLTEFIEQIPNKAILNDSDGGPKHLLSADWVENRLYKILREIEAK